jgi:hypothetical protein
MVAFRQQIDPEKLDSEFLIPELWDFLGPFNYFHILIGLIHYFDSSIASRTALSWLFRASSPSCPDNVTGFCALGHSEFPREHGALFRSGVEIRNIPFCCRVCLGLCFRNLDSAESLE